MPTGGDTICGHILDTTGRHPWSLKWRLVIQVRSISGFFRAILGIRVKHTAHNRGVAGSSPALATLAELSGE